MISANQSFDDQRTIRVLVVPIGTNSSYEEQFKLLSEHKEVPLFEIRPSNWNSNESPLNFMVWDDGYFLYEYVKYDRAFQSSDLDYYQSSRRVLVIIGLINFSELADTNIENELESYAKRFPHIIVKRVFLFGYSFDEGVAHTEVPSCPNLGADILEIFPPDKVCEDGRSMMTIHLLEVIGSFSRKIFSFFENLLVGYLELKTKNKFPPHPLLITTYDDISDAEMKQNMKKVNTTKRQVGRLKKWMGDICLQICALGDAMEQYLGAINDLRALGDSMWLAGALEGLAVAILIVLKLGLSVEDYLGKEIVLAANVSAVTVEVAAFRLVEERLMESISLLSRTEKCGVMASEGCLRLARTFLLLNSGHYFRSFEETRRSLVGSVSSPGAGVEALGGVMSVQSGNGSPGEQGKGGATNNEIAGASSSSKGSGKHNRETSGGSINTENILIDPEDENNNFVHMYAHRADRTMKAVDLVMKATLMPNLSSMQRVECTLVGALLSKQFEMHRKYIYFLFKAVLLYIEAKSLPAAVELLTLIARLFEADDVADGGKNFEMNRIRWISLNRAVLELLTKFCVEIGDLNSAARASSSLLRLQSNCIEKYEALRNYWGSDDKEIVESDVAADRVTGIAVSRDAAVSPPPVPLSEKDICTEDMYDDLTEFEAPSAHRMSSPLFNAFRKKGNPIHSSSSHVNPDTSVIETIVEASNDVVVGVHDPLAAYEPSSISSPLPRVLSEEISPDSTKKYIPYPNWGTYVSPSEQESAWILFGKIYRALNPGNPSSLDYSFLVSLRLARPSYDFRPYLGYVLKKDPCMINIANCNSGHEPSSQSITTDRITENINGALEPSSSVPPSNPPVSSTALFYDPFAAKKAAEQDVLCQDLVWSIGQIGTCNVILCNRFSLSLLLENLEVVWDIRETEDFFVTPLPQNILLPANCKGVRMELGTKILKKTTYSPESVFDNKLHMKGIQFSLDGSSVFVPLEDKAVAISAPMKIFNNMKRITSADNKEVILPDEEQVETLYIDKEEMSTSVMIAPEIADVQLKITGVGVQNNSINIHRGEKRAIVLNIRNISAELNVENFRISVKKHCTTSYSASQQKQKQKKSVLLDFTGKLEGSSTDYKAVSGKTASDIAQIDNFTVVVKRLRTQDGGCDKENRQINASGGEVSVELELSTNVDFSQKKVSNEFDIVLEVDIAASNIYNNEPSEKKFFAFCRKSIQAAISYDGMVVNFGSDQNKCVEVESMPKILETRLLKILALQDKPSLLSKTPMQQTHRISLLPSNVLHLTSVKSNVSHRILLFPGLLYEELTEKVSTFDNVACRNIHRSIDCHKTEENWVLRSDSSGNKSEKAHTEDSVKNMEGLDLSSFQYVILEPYTTCTLTSVCDKLDLQAGIPWLLVHHEGIRMGLLALSGEETPSRGDEEKTIEKIDYDKINIEFRIELEKGKSELIAIRKMYRIYITGAVNLSDFGRELDARQSVSVSLIIRVVAIENNTSRQPCINDNPMEDVDVDTNSQICAHGSKSVMFTGQTRRVIQEEVSLNSIKRGKEASCSDSNVCIRHELDICFMNSGHFSIYLLWKQDPSSTTWFSTLKPLGLEVFA